MGIVRLDLPEIRSARHQRPLGRNLRNNRARPILRVLMKGTAGSVKLIKQRDVILSHGLAQSDSFGLVPPTKSK